MSTFVGKAGEQHHNAKLSEAQAREIIALRRAGTPLAPLASKYKISISHACSIARGYRWAHIGNPCPRRQRAQPGQPADRGGWLDGRLSPPEAL